MSEFATHLKVALCQVQVGADKVANIQKIEEAISGTGDAQLVVRPNYIG
jgi:predicted amidohydrolase